MNTTYYLYPTNMNLEKGTVDYSLLFCCSWLFMFADWLLFIWWSKDTENELIATKIHANKMEDKIHIITNILTVYIHEKMRLCNDEILSIKDNIAMYNIVLEMLKDIDYVSLGHIQKRQDAVEYMKDFFPGIPVSNIPKVFFYKPAHIKMQIAEQTREIVKKHLLDEETLLQKQEKIIEKFEKMQSFLS